MSGQAEGERDNNFGALRLAFAALVVVSHSAEMLDGNRSRKILSRIFGTMTFGEFAVDGFFLVSGYLIAKSFAQQPQIIRYLGKRCLRIVPAYLAAFWICVLAVAPFAGGAHSPLFIEGLLKSNLLLEAPEVGPVFQGLAYPMLNGPMWTISYEFFCYLAVGAIGAACIKLGILAARGRWALLVGTAFGLVFAGSGIYPSNAIGLATVFGVGALFYLFRGEIVLNGKGAIVCALLMAAALYNRYLAEAGVAVFGGYVLFWLALKTKAVKTGLADGKTDISYGLYLYAWPIQNLLIWNQRDINPWILCAVSLVSAGLAGYASWHLIEKRALGLARRFDDPRKPVLVCLSAARAS